jgi:hypothetical protein
VRGFSESRLGPKDSFGNPYGGNLKVVGRAELLFPERPVVGEHAHQRLHTSATYFHRVSMLRRPGRHYAGRLRVRLQ